MSRAPEAIAKLDAHGLEQFVDDILDGKSYAQIAEALGISKAAIYRWLVTDSSRSARVKDALTLSAQGEDDKAEEVLLRKDLDPVTKRELAHHYRWRARVRNPREYGDKLEIDQTTKVVNLSPEELQAELDRIRKARQAAITSTAEHDPWALPSSLEPRLEQ